MDKKLRTWNLCRRSAVIACAWLSVCGGPLSTLHAAQPPNKKPDRARVVFSTPVSGIRSDHLKVTIVEVHYGPGEASPAHTHSCAVIGYVTEGSIRTQLKGQSEMIRNSGESFYEPPNAIHLVSRNASATEPASMLAYMLCDHDGPLSTNVSEGEKQKGAAR